MGLLLCKHLLKVSRVVHGVHCVVPHPVGGVHLVDIWNVIEALRENALNNLDPSIELNVARLEAVISTIFYQLNKRMPTTHQINVEQSISLLLNFLLAAFDPEGHDIFSMISDSSGVMVYGRYDMFLREVLKLPTAVFEGPSFGYTEQSAKSCFSQQSSTPSSVPTATARA
ncbi:hypothetical protein DV515_00000238 [Chloebia gouldiae]|uniref:EF-hand domain-containing protein n=1 Tax=Chloebia gouldiae TaxID=44316 RepID=A0A3L8T186_CHLGU|nr:hypothetical protein DV515_00000238 [Chloebia gouldiae]